MANLVPTFPLQRMLTGLLVVTWLVLGTACASDPAQPRTLRLATGSEGGTYDQIGADISRQARRSGFRHSIKAIPSKGTEENLRLLREREAELALVTQDALMALSDEERAAFCIVGPLYRGGAQFILRRALVRSGTVADLHGVHFYPGAAGSGTEASTLVLLDILHIQPDFAPRSSRTLGYSDSAAALAEGRFDAIVLSGGPPVAAVTRLLQENPRKFVLLSFTGEQIEKATNEIPGLYPSQISGGTYPGQSEPILTVGKQTVLIARADLNASITQRLAEALEKSIQEPLRGLRREDAHPMLQALTPDFWKQEIELPRCETRD